MANRPDLQTKLEEILGSRNVYFDPPESTVMSYDAIRYVPRKIDNTFADDTVYKQDNSYTITAIYRRSDSDLPRKISQLPMCTHDRHYKSNNLNHDVFTLYW